MDLDRRDISAPLLATTTPSMRDVLSGRTLLPRSWKQLAYAWVLFVVSAGLYHVPATLLDAQCLNATMPCSVGEEFRAHGATNDMIGWLPSTFLLVKGILAVPAGSAIFRFGTRLCIIAGNILLLVSTALYCTTFAFGELYALYALFGVAYTLAGLVPMLVFTNSWFDAQHKATSIGVLTTGYAMSGIIWPAVTSAVAQAHGWRVAAALLPISTFVIGLPVAALLLRDGPHAGRPGTTASSSTAPPGARGASSDGIALVEPHPEGGSSDGVDASVAGTQSDSMDAAGVAPRTLSPPGAWHRDPVVWYLGGMSVLILYIINGVQHWIVAFLTSDEVGVSLTAAGLYTSLTFASSLVGKLIWGVLLDRAGWQRCVAAVVGCLILAVGSGLTLRPSADAASGRWTLGPVASQAQLVAFALVFGAGWGAAFTLVQSRAAQLYGQRADFAKLQSALAVGQYVGSFLGVWTTSTLRDRATGSFVKGFAILPVLGLLNCVLCVRVFWR